jgi:hypothetical protein
MKNWWEIPATKGAEYDEYDYFYTELPQGSREWSTWGYKCSECGKWHKLNVVYTEYFYTLDGYDSLSTEVCWLCEMKSMISRPFRKVKRSWKILKETIELKRELPNKSWKKCYEFAKILQK